MALHPKGCQVFIPPWFRRCQVLFCLSFFFFFLNIRQMLSIDNSESMRNGDYLPSRFEAQSDAVNLLANAKTSQNPESTVGLITMAGKRVEVLQTLVQDPTDVLSALHKVQISGESDLAAALQVGQLALKHRANKNGTQRLVVFIGSPIKEDAKALARLGKKIRKSGVELDLISLGDDLEGDERLTALVEAVNERSGKSHYVHVPSGVGMISDVLVSTPIFFSSGDEGGDAGGAAAGGGGGGGAAAGGGGAPRPMMGVDPNVDPDLYEAIQMSLREQEERERGAASTTAATPAGAGTTAPTPGAPVSNNNNNPARSTEPGGVAPMDLGDDMDEEMRNAIALSLQMQQQGGSDDLYSDTTPVQPAKPPAATSQQQDDEDAEALKLSLALAEQSQKEEQLKAALQDQEYVKQLFGDLPVDLDDKSIQAALEQITKGGSDKKDEKKDEKESDPKKKK